MIYEMAHEMAATELPKAVLNGSKAWLGAGIAAVGLGGGIGLKGWVNVGQQEVALVTHRDRPYRRRTSVICMQHRRKGCDYGWVGPGMHPVVPFTHGVHRITPTDRTTDLEVIRVDTKERRQQEIHSSIIWGVPVPPPDLNRRERREYMVRGVPYSRVLRRAIFESADEDALTKNVATLARGGLREVLGEVDIEDPKDLHGDELIEPLIRFCGQTIFDKYGVELRGLTFGTTARSNASVIGEAMEHARSVEEQVALWHEYNQGA